MALAARVMRCFASCSPNEPLTAIRAALAEDRFEAITRARQGFL